jgi:hypothetical protein
MPSYLMPYRTIQRSISTFLLVSHFSRENSNIAPRFLSDQHNAIFIQSMSRTKKNKRFITSRSGYPFSLLRYESWKSESSVTAQSDNHTRRALSSNKGVKSCGKFYSTVYTTKQCKRTGNTSQPAQYKSVHAARCNGALQYTYICMHRHRHVCTRDLDESTNS